MITERPISTAQVAQILGVSRSTILGLARQQENPLPSIKIGAHYRFFWSDVAKFFNIPADKQGNAEPKAVQEVPVVSQDINDDYDQEI
jgi:excisionase family DNA binding protein